MPSTSLICIVNNEKETRSTLPRTSSSSARRRCTSRIPILMASPHHSIRSQSTLISSPTATLRSRSLRSRSTRLMTPSSIIVTKARESVSECSDTESHKWLSLEKGEQVRVLSIRGDLSRCCRIHSRHGFVLNGIVPTHKLDLY